MSYEGRIFVSWNEAAEMLGTDAEGLRQLMLLRLSPTSGKPDDQWLPVMLDAPGDGFMTSLVCEHAARPTRSWNSRDNFYDAIDGETQLHFTDGSSLLLESLDTPDRWYATHGYGCGWSHCFAVAGHTLVVSPRSVVEACDQGGRPGGIVIAPRAWCTDGFAELAFAIVECDNSVYRKRPTHLFESARFLRDDVIRVKNGLKAPTKELQRAAGLKLRSDAEENYLRVIALLWAHTDLDKKPNTAADSLLREAALWGWDKPGKDTIAKAMTQAASLAAGKHPKFG